MTRPTSPPRLAEWLIRRTAPRADAEFVIGDLREEFDTRADTNVPAARAWYWRETLSSIVPLATRRWRLAARHAAAEHRGDPRMTSLLGDVRFALRLGRRSPLASTAVVATMALGIGATTAMFSAANAILLRPLPFAESGRVPRLNATLRDGRVIDGNAYPDLQDFRRSVPGIAELSALRTSDVTLQHGPEPRLIHTVEIDDSYGRVLALRVERGRALNPGDMVLNAAKVAVVSHDFWMREFGGDPALVGKTITLDDESVQVVGILAAGAYTYPTPRAEAVRPLIIQPNTPMTNRGSMWATAVAKLRPGASFDQAQADLAATAARIAKEFPNSNTQIGVKATQLREAVVGSVAPMLELLASAVAAVLLVACVNIANLILGRAQARSREFAVRSALGGSPARVRQQVLIEGLVLATIGGLLGAAIAPTLTHALVAIYPDELPRAGEIGIDARVLLVAALATISAGLLSALPTAQRAARLDLANDLRDGGRTVGGRRERRAGGTLIVAQVAASLALLFSAGLLLKTFMGLTRVNPGFDARNTTTFHVLATRARYAQAADIDRYYGAATQALQQIPGVTSVSTTTLLPFAGGRFYDTYILEDRGDQHENNPGAAVATIEPGLERALGMTLTSGRGFLASDDSASERVLVINTVMARRDFPGVDPVGHLINWNGQPHWRIVGVVGSVHLDQLWGESMPILYAPVKQAPRRARYFVIRSERPSEQVLAAARAELHRIDPTIALTDPATMEHRITASLGPQRFRAALMLSIGGLALGLAIIGIYGVVAYAVSRRTREIGIRMALGEAAAAVRRRVIADALAVAAVGIVVGVGLSLLAGRWLTVFLVDVSPSDPRMLTGAAGILVAVVAIAAYGPARRAAGVDPITALRAD